MNKELIQQIEQFLKTKHLISEWRQELNKHLSKPLPEQLRQFFEEPASSIFHENYVSGLVEHSFRVYLYALKLSEAFGNIEINADACLLHDLCKIGAYELYEKNVKIGGYWEKQQAYKRADDYVAIQHGAESLRILHKIGIELPDAWEFAVAYHMGAFAQSDIEGFSKACERYPEVLLLHTADMMSIKLQK